MNIEEGINVCDVMMSTNLGLVEFTSANLGQIVVQSESSYWGTHYYAVPYFTVSMVASRRIPETPGVDGLVSLVVNLSVAGVNASKIDVPSGRETEPPNYYYYPAGPSSRANQISLAFGTVRPDNGIYEWVMTFQATEFGNVVGEQTFNGTVSIG